jgi:hemerythrin-like domain-containing protein
VTGKIKEDRALKATEELMKEHRGIELMLRVLGVLSVRGKAGEPLNIADLDGIVEFLTVFADKCHHGKEEEHLFPALEAVGIPGQGGPIGVMLAEHVEGRSIIRRLVAAVAEYKEGKSGAAVKIALAAKDYEGLLSQHIYKEDNILYPMAQGRISDENDTALVEAFEALERDRIGPGKHEAFHELLHHLEKAYLKG